MMRRASDGCRSPIRSDQLTPYRTFGLTLSTGIELTPDHAIDRGHLSPKETTPMFRVLSRVSLAFLCRQMWRMILIYL